MKCHEMSRWERAKAASGMMLPLARQRRVPSTRGDSSWESGSTKHMDELQDSIGSSRVKRDAMIQRNEIIQTEMTTRSHITYTVCHIIIQLTQEK